MAKKRYKAVIEVKLREKIPREAQLVATNFEGEEPIFYYEIFKEGIEEEQVSIPPAVQKQFQKENK